VTVDSGDLIGVLRPQRVFPVIRTNTVSDAIATARICLAEGMRVIELTTSTPGVEDAVAALAQGGAVVGVGTIRSADQLASIAEAGARFVVSYFEPESFVHTSHALGLVPIPGVLTPNEMQSAVTRGARILKIFPAWQSNPRVIADMVPLLGAIDYVATAGLTPPLMRDWLSAGALAVGVGRSLGTVETIGERTVRGNVRDLLEFRDQCGAVA